MVAVLLPKVAQVAVKETVKVVLDSLVMVLLDGALMLNSGLLTVVLVRFKSKLPVFLMVKVFVTVLPILISPKSVPSKTFEVLSPFSMFVLLPSTTISEGNASYAPIVGGSKRVVPRISYKDPVVAPAPPKPERAVTYKPSSMVPKTPSTPTGSFIFTKGSVVRGTKSVDPLILPAVISEALLLEFTSILVPEISERLPPTVLP